MNTNTLKRASAFFLILTVIMTVFLLNISAADSRGLPGEIGGVPNENDKVGGMADGGLLDGGTDRSAENGSETNGNADTTNSTDTDRADTNGMGDMTSNVADTSVPPQSTTAPQTNASAETETAADEAGNIIGVILAVIIAIAIILLIIALVPKKRGKN